LVTDFTMPRTALSRYVLYQIPGWLLAVAAAVVLYRRVGLPGWAAVAFVVAWALKDAALYPFLRTAYEPDPRSVIERLVGMVGIAVEPLTPRGYVRVRGELWLAKPTAEDATIGSGHSVTIDAVSGTTLMVSRVEPPRSGATTLSV